MDRQMHLVKNLSAKFLSSQNLKNERVCNVGLLHISNANEK